MKYVIISLCLMACSLCANANSAPDFLVSLPDAKYKAATEGKLYFLKFTADWCRPCQWMDEHTFTDQRVQTYINANYVPVKINVDDFDGMVIKQKYEVEYLPTLIIFNSKGKEVARFSESLGPSRLLTILEENNTPRNSLRQKAEAPVKEVSPVSPVITRPHLPQTNTPSPIVSETSVPPLEVPSNTNKVEDKPGTNTSDVINSKPVTVTTNTSINAEEMAFLNGEGIFEIDVKYQVKEGYSIQIGVYKEYNNVLAEVNKYKKSYGERVFVHIDKLNGQTVYRILIGHFTDANQANSKKIGLESTGTICYVRNLADM